ncbi:MAG: hypothetical protein WAZ20_02650 [Methanothrix sp.]|jgi:hypothetical protein|uniref:hypothetical protein n=1 Tax=Methanothrix sp. TaxID=90426 RepID=UPI001BD50764|nr:hypothetical protein [Methanothrix sp.]
MHIITELLNHPILSTVGAVTTLFALFSCILVILTGYLYLKGIIQVWIRIGRGLAKRKIAVFADREFNSLRSMLVDSGLFLKSNVVQIEKNSIKKAMGMTLFLVHWDSFESQIEKILELKEDHVGLIIYAPQDEGKINQAEFNKIANERNTIVVNLRGRLLNDIFISMITTGNPPSKY